MASDLRSLLSSVQPIVAEEVTRVFSEVRSQAAQDDPWSARLIDFLEHTCLLPGKMVRPVLVSLGASEARGVSVEEAWQDPGVRRAMVIVQLLHKRLLIADDIADRDELRNDEPALHIQMYDWMKQHEPYTRLTDENIQHFARSYTEVAGIWLQQMITSELVALQSQFPPQKWQEFASDLNRYGYQITVAGWITLMDQGHEVLSEKVSRERFLQGLYQVTGAYTFTTPLLLGTAFGEQANISRDKIIELGKNLGILFQLRDDTLGLFGETSITGKPVGGDVREGKKTLYMQEAYQRSKPADQKRLQSLLGNAELTDEDVLWVQNLVRTSGAYDAVELTIQEYRTVCHQILETWPDEQSRVLLMQLTEAMANRQK